MPDDMMKIKTTRPSRQKLQLKLNTNYKLIKYFYRKERPAYPVVNLPKIIKYSSTII